MADAGPDQTVSGGDTVTLNGSGSSDPDSDALTYAWRGGGFDLTGRNPAFVAPAVDSQQRIVFTLTVSDGSLADTDTVIITVRNAPPSPGIIIPPPLPGMVIQPPLILPPLPPLLPDTTPPTTLPTGGADPDGSASDCLTLVFNMIFGGPVTGVSGTDPALPRDGIFRPPVMSPPALATPDRQAAGDAVTAGWPGAAASVAVGSDAARPVTNGPIVRLTAPDCADRTQHSGILVPAVDMSDLYNPGFGGTDPSPGSWTLVVRDSREWWGGILEEWGPGAGAAVAPARPYLVTVYAGPTEPSPDAAGDHGTAGKADTIPARPQACRR